MIKCYSEENKDEFKYTSHHHRHVVSNLEFSRHGDLRTLDNAGSKRGQYVKYLHLKPYVVNFSKINIIVRLYKVVVYGTASFLRNCFSITSVVS